MNVSLHCSSNFGWTNASEAYNSSPAPLLVGIAANIAFCCNPLWSVWRCLEGLDEISGFLNVVIVFDVLTTDKQISSDDWANIFGGSIVFLIGCESPSSSAICTREIDWIGSHCDDRREKWKY